MKRERLQNKVVSLFVFLEKGRMIELKKNQGKNLKSPPISPLSIDFCHKTNKKAQKNTLDLPKCFLKSNKFIFKFVRNK